jgi:hypothetical protein
VTFLTSLSTLAAFHQYASLSTEFFSKYVFGISAGGAFFGWFTYFSQKLERKRAIAQIHLVQHPNNKDYSQELILVRADGEEVTGKIADISVSSNSEDQLILDLKG